MNDRAVPLAVVGNISRDITRYSSAYKTSLGGAALHIALAAGRAGLPAAPVAVIGPDLDHLRTDPRLNGVDWSATATHAGKSTTFTLTYNESDELVGLDADYGVAANLTEHALTQIRTGFACAYHVCCRRPLDIPTVLDALIQSDHPFSIDFMISSAHVAVAATKHLIHHADPVFVNAAEHELLTAMADAPRTVITTDGPRPVRLFHHGRLAATITPPPAAAVEVTGAGDTLTGTFLAARAGLSDRDALQLAIAAATHHITTPRLAIEPP